MVDFAARVMKCPKVTVLSFEKYSLILNTFFCLPVFRTY